MRLPAVKIPQDSADEWFSQWFRDDYLLLYQHRDEEEAHDFLDRILPELDVEPPDWLLDLACGAGRHSHYLASKGFRVVGFDLSNTLLTKASSDEPESKASWVQGDMRAVAIQENSMSAVFNLFTSFGYFLDETDNITVVKEIARILKLGGRFVLDTLNPEYVEATLVPRSEHHYRSDQSGGSDVRITEERSVDRERHRIVKKIRIQRNNQTTNYIESVRMYSVNELYRMLKSQSLHPVLLWGDYQGTEYKSMSPRIIIVAQAYA